MEGASGASDIAAPEDGRTPLDTCPSDGEGPGYCAWRRKNLAGVFGVTS
jgi:hypothetical protein